MAEQKRREAEYHRMSQQVTEAKLSALQAQVEPHFLYNTLASVQALTEVDPQQANAMTGHLIQYLRNALPKMRESVSTVGQEIELVRAYLNILQMRMGKRLAFDIDVPPELMDAPFPPLMLPSLVENAIKHGLEPQREGGTGRHHAPQADGDRLRLIGHRHRPRILRGAGAGRRASPTSASALPRSTATTASSRSRRTSRRACARRIEVPRDGTRTASAPAAAASAARTEPDAAPMPRPSGRGGAHARRHGHAPSAPGARVFPSRSSCWWWSPPCSRAWASSAWPRASSRCTTATT